MKRTAALIIPVLLLTVLVVVVVAQIPQGETLPEDVQNQLDQYIAYTYPPRSVTMVAVEQARRPWNFYEEMSYTSFGDSVVFQTDTGPTYTQRLNLTRLYYPPKEMWCALLEIADARGGSPSYAVVFVGLHLDMYNADLVVHEGARDLSSKQFGDDLVAIGCDLELTQMGPRP